jgi:hypothetical protein
MTKPGIVCRAAVAALFCLALPASAAPERSDFGFLQTSAVRVIIRTPGKIAGGTGWVAVTADAAHNANNAVIVTAAHVVRGAEHITVLEANNPQELDASVRAVDLDRDIAFLEVRGLRNGGVPLSVTSVVPPIGQEVRTTGYTQASDLPSRSDVAEMSGVLSGTYSRTIPNPRPIWSLATVGVAQFQHSIPLSRGFSGGPVIDKCGRVVGINIMIPGTRTRDGVIIPAPGIGFAVASAEIIKAAEEHGIRLTEDASLCPDQMAGGSTGGGSSPPQAATPATGGDSSAPSWWRGQTGMAALVGLFALAALGLGAWLFFGKSGRAPAPALAEPIRNRDSLRITTGSARATAAIAPAAPEPALQILTLSGRGPSGEPINLRFTSEEMQSQGRTIGTESEVHVPDNRTKTLVSRIHAELSWDGEHFFIKDLKSLNGTKVDGQPLAPLEVRRLRDGASVTLADVTLNVQID